MNEDITEMITEGIELTEEVVETIRENTKRAIRFMAAAVDERGAPEVVGEDVRDGRLLEQVLILEDCPSVKRENKKPLIL